MYLGRCLCTCVFTVLPPAYSHQCRDRSWPAQIEGCLAKGKREHVRQTPHPQALSSDLRAACSRRFMHHSEIPKRHEAPCGIFSDLWIIHGRVQIHHIRGPSIASHLGHFNSTTARRVRKMALDSCTLDFIFWLQFRRFVAKKLGDQVVSVSLASLGNTWRLRAEIFDNGLSSHRRVGCRPSSLISLDLISNQIYHWFFSSSYG
jgi:hypothetical protein